MIWFKSINSFVKFLHFKILFGFLFKFQLNVIDVPAECQCTTIGERMVVTEVSFPSFFYFQVDFWGESDPLWKLDWFLVQILLELCECFVEGNNVFQVSTELYERLFQRFFPDPIQVFRPAFTQLNHSHDFCLRFFIINV